jgi:hypothetical protein
MRVASFIQNYDNSLSRRVRWVGHVARRVQIKNAYKILIRKLEANRPLGRPRLILEENIRMDLREGGWEGVEWIHLAQDRDN